MREITYISFGAGVQSTALLVMSNLGMHDCPRADVAIFADTGDEPGWVYECVERMQKWSKIPVKVVQFGHLSEDFLAGWKDGQRNASIPLFIAGRDGRAAPIGRQCTSSYKIEPIQKYVRELCGLKKGERAKGVIDATSLLGISLDEATRMKPSKVAWVRNEYPLVSAKLRRTDCRRIVLEAGFPEPRRSSCVYCPYHGDEFWRKLQEEHPEEWQRCVELDNRFRHTHRRDMSGPFYLHRSLRPLGEIDFDRQGRLFPDLEDEECEGGCFL